MKTQWRQKRRARSYTECALLKKYFLIRSCGKWGSSGWWELEEINAYTLLTMHFLIKDHVQGKKYSWLQKITCYLPRLEPASQLGIRRLSGQSSFLCTPSGVRLLVKKHILNLRRSGDLWRLFGNLIPLVCMEILFSYKSVPCKFVQCWQNTIMWLHLA